MSHTASPASRPAGPDFDGPGDQEQLFDVRHIFNVLRRRLSVIFGTMAVITGITLLVVFQLTPQYTATSLVLIDPREQQVVDIEAVMSGLPPDSAAIDSEVEVLRSRTLAARVVDQLELVADPEFNSALTEPGLLAALDPRRWFGSDQPVEEATRDQRETNRVIDAFQDRLSVGRRGLTYVISISFRSPDA